MAKIRRLYRPNGIQVDRILLFSPYQARQRRATVELAHDRNRLVANLASQVFMAYAARGGKTEELCREIVANPKPLFMVDCSEDANLISLGTQLMAIHQLVKQ